jgi:hypothetical protein
MGAIMFFSLWDDFIKRIKSEKSRQPAGHTRQESLGTPPGRFSRNHVQRLPVCNTSPRVVVNSSVEHHELKSKDKRLVEVFTACVDEDRST